MHRAIGVIEAAVELARRASSPAKNIHRAIVVAVAAVLLAGVLAAPGQAQVHIDFGVGHHHHGHYHGHRHGWSHFDWHYHDWCYPRWYAPPVDYVYVVPPARRYTVVEPAPVYSAAAPAATSTAQPTPAPAPRLATQPNALPESATSVSIRNPDNAGGPVYFVIDGQTEYELAPGEDRTLRGRKTMRIEFDRGGDFGAVERDLTAGTYQFVVTDEGWDLRRDAVAWRPPAKAAARKNTLPPTRR